MAPDSLPEIKIFHYIIVASKHFPIRKSNELKLFLRDHSYFQFILISRDILETLAEVRRLKNSTHIEIQILDEMIDDCQVFGQKAE